MVKEAKVNGVRVAVVVTSTRQADRAFLEPIMDVFRDVVTFAPLIAE